MSVILGLRSGCQWVMGSKGYGHLSSLTFSIHVLLSRSTAAHLALLHRLSICWLTFGRIMEYWVSRYFTAYILLVVTTKSLLSLRIFRYVVMLFPSFSHRDHSFSPPPFTGSHTWHRQQDGALVRSSRPFAIGMIMEFIRCTSEGKGNTCEAVI